MNIQGQIIPVEKLVVAVSSCALFNLVEKAFFLSGRDKGEFLKAFSADIFFDEQHKHCESARQHVATGHMPHRVANE